MKSSSSAILVSLTLMCCIYTAHYAYCFDDQKTHPELTRIAIKNSKINVYLVNTFVSRDIISINLQKHQLAWMSPEYPPDVVSKNDAH